MEELIRKLQEVSRKTSQLSAAVNDLQQEREILLTRIKELEDTLTGKEASLRRHETSQGAARKGQLSLDGVDREALQAQIDRYLQEIDLCLKRFGD